MKAKEIFEQRKATVAEMRKLTDLIHAEKRDFTSEERVKWDAMNAEYDSLKARESELTSLEQREREIEEFESAPSLAIRGAGRGDVNHKPETKGNEDRSAVTDEDYGRAFKAWALAPWKPSEITDEDIRASKKVGINPQDREVVIRFNQTPVLQQRQDAYRSMDRRGAHKESRALTTSVGASGGFTIAPLFNANFEEALLYYGPMMQVAEIVRTKTAADFPYPTINETTKTGSYVAENTAISTAEDIDFALTMLHAYKATTNAILIPHDLFRDTAINLTAMISKWLGQRFGRFINTEATTGTSKAKGIVTQATTGVTSASSTAITADELIDLFYSIDRSYRDAPGFGFMYNDAMEKYFRKLKDGNGAYIWGNGLNSGAPDTLLNKPTYVNNDMASSLVSGAVPVIAGDLQAFKIRLVEEIRLTQTSERYWEYDQMAFAAYSNFDAGLVDAGTHPVKKLVQV